MSGRRRGRGTNDEGGSGALGDLEADDANQVSSNSPPKGSYARRVSRLRRSNMGSHEQCLLVEGAGTTEDSSILWILFLSSVFTCGVGLWYALSSGSMGVITEVTSEFIDMTSYAVNLWCMYICKGESLQYKERMEFKCAFFSTALLGIAGIRIMLTCWAQFACSGDIAQGSGHMACALMMERPAPNTLLFMSCFMLASYTPLVLYIMCGKSDTDSYDAKEDINKASAVLHAQSDIAEQIIFIIAAFIMKAYPANNVEIDASATLFVVVVLVAFTARMWYKYHAPLSQAEMVRH